MFENLFGKKKEETVKKETQKVVKRRKRKKEVGQSRSDLDVYRLELLTTLDELQDKVDRSGLLKISTIRDLLNEKLPEGVGLHSRSVGNMLRRMKLIVVVGSANLRFLLWEPNKLKRLCRKYEKHTQMETQPTESDDTMKGGQLSLDIIDEGGKGVQQNSLAQAVIHLMDGREGLWENTVKMTFEKLKDYTKDKSLDDVYSFPPHYNQLINNLEKIQTVLSDSGIKFYKTNRKSDGYYIIFKNEVDNVTEETHIIDWSEPNRDKSKYEIKVGKPTDKKKRPPFLYEQFPFDKLESGKYFIVEKNDKLIGKVQNAVVSYRRNHKSEDFVVRSREDGGLNVYRIK